MCNQLVIQCFFHLYVLVSNENVHKYMTSCEATGHSLTMKITGKALITTSAQPFNPCRYQVTMDSCFGLMGLVNMAKLLYITNVVILWLGTAQPSSQGDVNPIKLDLCVTRIYNGN